MGVSSRAGLQALGMNEVGRLTRSGASNARRRFLLCRKPVAGSTFGVEIYPGWSWG